MNTDTLKIHQGATRDRKGNCNIRPGGPNAVSISAKKAEQRIKDPKDFASACGKCMGAD